MAEIAKAHIFEVGTWNSVEITPAVLDSMVESFAALANAGRVPLKLGHNDAQPVTDGQPALGWVTKVWREGSSLFATFAGMPGAVYDSVKKGLYKFVSVEILRNVQAAGRTWPAVLDAVALLGADRPAVTNLRELSRLAATRADRPLTCEAVQMFSTAFAPPDDREDYATLSGKVAQLTCERDDFKRRAEASASALDTYRKRVDSEEFSRRANEWCRDGSITPAMRDLVLKRLQDPAVAQTFSALDLLSSMRGKPGTRGFPAGLVTGRNRQPGGENLDNPVAELSLATREYARQNGVDVFTAMGAVARLRSDLVEPVMTQYQRFRAAR